MQTEIHIPHPDLLAKIEAHCRDAGVSETAFGKDAVKDPNLVRDLRSGRELRRATVAKVMDALSSSQDRP
ncbi:MULTISPECIES: hypothetical protein [unclassified Phaeobacter]|uniref:hypothetical protein n=1 Tax=unclassified Phaeobacter TaxID=2621772 RepID=UPI003A88A23A